MNTSVKILKLTNQVISKSWNSNMNRKIKTRGFQRDQNCLISPCILRVIAPASQIQIKNEQSMVKHQI